MGPVPANITLTGQEAQLRQLLLDASSYIGNIEGKTKPELRFTGGWVRDKLLGTTSPDIDVGIDNMTGFQFATLLKQYLEDPKTQISSNESRLGSLAKIAANPEKSKHLETVTTRLLGFDIDLVNLRKETYTDDSRNPSMEFGTAQEDALRRDATVNALFYNLNTSQVEDFTERGLDDMSRKVIKTPLSPLQTFKDDPLRVLRCIRFASRLEYDIDPEDETAMADPSIKNALRLKISRERVGIEITKMFKGRHPVKALRLIDRLGLYNDIFTNPHGTTNVDTSSWPKAYEWLDSLIHKSRSAGSDVVDISILNRVLIRDSNDEYRAWVLASIIPWARITPMSAKQTNTKKTLRPASIAIREGIKSDNKICKMVDDAATFFPEAIDMKKQVNAASVPLDSPRKRKGVSIGRDTHGLLLRKWGSDWRAVIVFALLLEVSEAQSQADSREIAHEYALWMLELESMRLLDVDKMAPLVRGDRLCEALGSIQKGPWMKQAIEIAVEWQLRNPDETDPSGGITEVLQRRDELDIP